MTKFLPAFFSCCVVLTCLLRSSIGKNVSDSVLESFNEKDKSDNTTSAVNSTTSVNLSDEPEGRSLKYLTPGQEFLLSVASFEDAKGSNWDSVPYLMNVLNGGNLDVRSDSNNKKGDKSSIATSPMRMNQMMKVMTAIEKADSDDGSSDNGIVNSFFSFLNRLSQDPMNVLLAAIIPFSILLAAVIPLLVNQLMGGSLIPTISTTASTGKYRQQRQFLDNMVPVLEGIASFGSKMSEEMFKQNTDKKKFSLLKIILQLISSFVNEKWIRNFGSTPVQRMRSCHGLNCPKK